MHRSKLKCSLRYIGYFCEARLRNQQVPKNVAHRAKWLQTAAGSEGSIRSGFAVAPVTNSLSYQIVNALQLGDRGKASSLLLNSNSQSHVLTERDIEFILEYCAKKPDPLFVMETWETLEGKDVVSGKCYLDMVHALCNGGYLKEAFYLVKHLGESKQISFIVPIYNCFLKVCMKMRDTSHIEQCLDLMKHQMVGKSEGTFSVLLTLAVWQKNLSAVHEIEKEFVEQYDMNIVFLRKLIWSYTRLKDVKSAYATLQHMIKLVNGGTVVKRNAEGKLYCPHFDIPVPQRCSANVNLKDSTKPFSALDDDEISTQRTNSKQCSTFESENMSNELFSINSTTVRKILRWSFSDVIYACGRVHNYEMAEQLIVQMQSLGLTPSRHTYDGFIKAVISERGHHDAIEVLKVMQERNLKPYNSTLAAISTGCSRALNLDLAEFFLNQISKVPSVDPYNFFLEACNRKDQPERAIKMFAKMKEMKLKPNARTFELLFSLFGNVNAPYEEGNMLSQADSAHRIAAIERDMLNNGIQHSLTSIRNLLKALGTEGMVKELMEKLRVAEELFSLHDILLGTDIYNIVLHSLVEHKQSRIAIELLRSMRRCRFPMDAASYNIMIDCCSNIRCLNSAHALISLMLRDGFYPDTPTYTALIKILIDHDDFDGALDLLDQTILEGNQPDVLLYNTFLSKASTQGRIDIIELITEQMHQQGVHPDPSTCQYVFSAYADSEFFHTAMEALQVLSYRMISMDNETLQEKRMKFEGIILSEDPETEKGIVQQLFVSSNKTNNIAAALLNLRWCAMLGFSISWQPSESPWATRLANASLSLSTEEIPM